MQRTNTGKGIVKNILSEIHFLPSKSLQAFLSMRLLEIYAYYIHG